MVDAAARFVSKAKSCSIERVLEANLDNATAAYRRLKLSPRKVERKGKLTKLNSINEVVLASPIEKSGAWWGVAGSDRSWLVY